MQCSGFCTPSEIWEFDADKRAQAILKTQKKSAHLKYIAAVKEICDLQDHRSGSAQKKSSEEDGGVIVEDDAVPPHDNGFEDQEDEQPGKEAESDEVKKENFLTQVVTLNQQDEVIPFNEGNLEEEIGDEDQKEWTERNEYNGGNQQIIRDLEVGVQEGKGSRFGGVFVRGQKVARESDTGRGGRRAAFGNALKRISQTSDRVQVAKLDMSQKSDGKDDEVSDHPGRKKKKGADRRNLRNPSPDIHEGVNGDLPTSLHYGVDSSGVLAETLEAEMSTKARVGRPSKASRQPSVGLESKLGGPESENVTKNHAGERKVGLNNGRGDEEFRGAGEKKARDENVGSTKAPLDNGHNSRGDKLKMKGSRNTDVKDEGLGGGGHDSKLLGSKGVPTEVYKSKKGLKREQTSGSTKTAQVHVRYFVVLPPILCLPLLLFSLS